MILDRGTCGVSCRGLGGIGREIDMMGTVCQSTCSLGDSPCFRCMCSQSEIGGNLGMRNKVHNYGRKSGKGVVLVMKGI